MDSPLTQETLDQLLSLLDADRDRAGEKYEDIRMRLISFFRWRNCASPEKYADQTIDRVARKTGEGAVITAKDPFLYFYGVALNILKEHFRETEKMRSALAEFATASLPAASREKEAACLDHCMEKLSANQRALVLSYHAGGEQGNIENRRRIAFEMGISNRELTHRVFRIRATLRDCILHCFDEAGL